MPAEAPSAQAPAQAPADYLTTAQAAAILGVNASRVRQLVLAGRLPAQKLGRDVLIRAEDVEQLRAGRGSRGLPLERTG